MKPLNVQSIRIKNFKAIQDTDEIKLTPLTAIIGGNGSGKSSFIEGLETYQQIVGQGLGPALRRWRGFEYVRNNAVPHSSQTPRRLSRTIEETDEAGTATRRVRLHEQLTQIYESNPFDFTVKGNTRGGSYSVGMTVSASPGSDVVFIQNEQVIVKGKKIIHRSDDGGVYFPPEEKNKLWPLQYQLPTDESVISPYRRDNAAVKAIADDILDWQFVTLNPVSMGDPRGRQQTAGRVRLNSDGSNIAEYLLDIYNKDTDAFNGLVDTLKDIIPYASDFRPNSIQDIDRSVYLEMIEGKFPVRGWMLSSGTLRVVALLALLRHPSPPPLIVIEEIENGLDPSTIHILIDEISYVVKNGISQIIFTTHSPYLLDYLSIDHILLVERSENQPVFYRPSDEAKLEGWKDHFRVGRLYTSGQLSRS